MHIRYGVPYTVGDPPTPIPPRRVSERFGPGNDAVQDGGDIFMRRRECEFPRTLLPKLSEKSRTPLQSSLTGNRNGTFRAVLAFVYWPNLRLNPRSDPFSDSFSRQFGE